MTWARAVAREPQNYSQRYCSLCPGVIGDELHIATACQHLSSVFVSHAAPFRGLFRLCHLSSFASLSPLDRLRVMLGNRPASLLVKHMPIWTAKATALYGQFDRDMLVHITVTAPSLALCLSEDSEDFSADDENNLFETLSPCLPANFSIDPLPSPSFSASAGICRAGCPPSARTLPSVSSVLQQENRRCLIPPCGPALGHVLR